MIKVNTHHFKSRLFFVFFRLSSLYKKELDFSLTRGFILITTKKEPPRPRKLIRFTKMPTCEWWHYNIW